MNRKSFLKGAATLALAGIAVRLIGALYRIPLQRIIGLDGIALYQMAYPVYSLLLTLSTAGIPGAISKLVSERVVHGDAAGARRIFRISLALLSAVGLASAAAMALGSGQVALFVAGRSIGPLAQPSMLAAAPALFFVAVITAFRGYFQGLQQMAPTAVSQILEQVVKIIPGFFIAAYLCRYGVEYGAAGAMWGVALSEVVAMLYLMIAYAAGHRRRADEMRRPGAVGSPLPLRQLTGRLVALALPMMAGAIFLPLASLADAFIVVNRLAVLGYDESATKALYGLLSGNVNVLLNVPGVLSLSLATSLIPAVAESHERADARAVERKCRVGLKATMLVAIPAAAGLAALAKPVLNLLYGPTLTEAQLDIGASLLASSCAGVLFLSVVQSTNGSLQGMGRVYVPMISLAAGAAVKIVMNYILVGLPSVNIHGAPLGTIACYFVPAVINTVALSKTTGMRLDIGGMLLRPGLAAGLMCAAAWLLADRLSAPLGPEAACAIAIVAAIPCYAVLAVLFGAIGRSEIMFLPKGKRIAAFLERYKLLKG